MEKRRRIGFFTAVLMVALAGFFDLLQFLVGVETVGTGVTGIGIPVAVGSYVSGYAITPYANFLLISWFWAKGVSFLDGKKIASTVVQLIIENVPALKDLSPGLTLYVIVIIVMVFLEDRGFNATQMLGIAGKKTPELPNPTIAAGSGIQGIKT